MMATDRPCPDDLVMRAHRGELSQLERRVLDAHLGQCPSCRAALAVARLFDAIPDRQPDDERLIARVASRATRRGERVWGRRWLQVAAAGLVVLASGVATARWIALRRHASEEARKVAESLSVARRAQRVALPPRTVPAEVPQAPEPSATEAEAESPVHARDVRAPSGSRGRGALPIEIEPARRDAASLFAEANAVRRDGELSRAIDLYRALRRQFPESNQSLLAAISLGDLLLGLGDPAAALAAYDSYLDHAPSGVLREEALFGRARSLGRLGRRDDERQTWEQLVRRYPHSAYRPAANRRLQELVR